MDTLAGRGFSYVLSRRDWCKLGAKMTSHRSLKEVLPSPPAYWPSYVTISPLPISATPSFFCIPQPGLVDFPATAKFLTPEERAFVVFKKSMCYFHYRLIFASTDFIDSPQSTISQASERRNILRCVIYGPPYLTGR